jgi:hypothetical protein
LKKEKHRKSSEKKKVRQSGEQTRGKDVRNDLENVNQMSVKHKELEDVTKSHLNPSVSHSQVNIKGSVNSSEYVSKLQARTEREQSGVITSLSHKFGTAKSGDDSESSHVSSLFRGNESTLKSIEECDAGYSEKSCFKKSSSTGKNNASSKVTCNSVEGACTVAQSSVLNAVTNSSIGAEAAAASRPKIILMQSDDDDDDEDFINIKADAEAGKLCT